jgi:hypothetical protein
MHADKKSTEEMASFLEQNGVHPEVFKMDSKQLEDYLKEKEIPIEELPKFILENTAP